MLFGSQVKFLLSRKKHAQFLFIRRVIPHIHSTSGLQLSRAFLSRYFHISCLRDYMFAFLNANGFAEHQIHKGFLLNISGSFEHSAQMANVINTARINQKSLVHCVT